MKTIWVLFLSVLGACSPAYAQYGVNEGKNCADAVQIYMDTDCNNTCGLQYCGNYNCMTAACDGGFYDLTGGNSSGMNMSCTADDETTKLCGWFKFTATANNITLTNDGPYAGPASSAANTKDFAIYSGTCGALTQVYCVALDGNDASTFSGLTTGQTYYILICTHAGGTTANFARACFTSTVAYTNPYNACGSSLTITDGVTYTLTNANTTSDGHPDVCGGSLENNIWARWCAPASWTPGATAYIHIFNQTCNSTQGLQFAVMNGGQLCSAFTGEEVCANPGVITDYYYTWPANPGECFYIQIDGYAGTGCTFDLVINNSPVVVTPADIVHILVRTGLNYNRLQWRVESESNVDRYEIQVYEPGSEATGEMALSEDQWHTLGSAGAKGPGDYEYVHRNPAGTSIYRIRVVDHDGTFEFSNSVHALRNGIYNDYETVVYPSPAGQQIHLTTGASSRVTLYSVAGNQVLSAEYDGVTGIDLGALPPGMYVYYVVREGETFTGKFTRE